MPQGRQEYLTIPLRKATSTPDSPRPVPGDPQPQGSGGNPHHESALAALQGTSQTQGDPSEGHGVYHGVHRKSILGLCKTDF